MNKHLKYLKYLARHKYFVFLAGRKTGAPLWRLVIHDWSKFTPAEWGPYVEFFYGPAHTPEMSAAFDRAWLHHIHKNAHHHQHWILREDTGNTVALEMPSIFVKEMLADWAGAGRAITGQWEVEYWYNKNKDRMVLHPSTRIAVEQLLRLL